MPCHSATALKGLLFEMHIQNCKWLFLLINDSVKSYLMIDLISLLTILKGLKSTVLYGLGKKLLLIN